MIDTQTRPGLLRRGWQRVLDGDRPWGSIEIRPDRFGVKRYRLVVYPPGLNTAERRLVRIARGFPVWGAAAWIVAEVVLSHLTGPWTALAMSTAAVVGAGIVTVAMAGEPRRGVRTLCASSMVGLDDPMSAEAVRKLKSFAGRLVDADDAMSTSRLSPAEHEMLWWQVYDEIGTYRRAATCA